MSSVISEFSIPISNCRGYTHYKRHKPAENDILNTMTGFMLFDVERRVFVYDEKCSEFQPAPAAADFKINVLMKSFWLVPSQH